MKNPIYGKSPLVAFCEAINNIKCNLWAKKRMKDKTFKTTFEDYKNHPEVIAAIDQIVSAFKTHKK